MKTALISVSDKSNLDVLLPFLKRLNIEIISTGGTAKRITELGYKVTEISKITGVEEYPDGLVKTLHPRIHFAILFDRENKEHLARIKKENIKPIDLVVCNLYPFENTVKKSMPDKEAVKNIDIGGVAMIRAAAKNHKYVTVITNPKDYQLICEELEKGSVSNKINKELAVKAFKDTAKYDSIISSHFEENIFPDNLILAFDAKQRLRYGENPHQEGYFYNFHNLDRQFKIKQLHGKELSYNNLNDLNAVIRILKEFMNHYKKEEVVIICKHTNPCGIATADNIYDAFIRAWNCDKTSAFGSVIGINSKINKKTAEFIASKFVEVILAPEYEDDALDVLKQKKNIRLMKIEDIGLFKKIPAADYAFLEHGLLAQTRDNKLYEKLELKSGNLDADKLKNTIEFGLLCIKNIKSNSINIVREHKQGCLEQIGVGIGQPNRVVAVKLAIEKAVDNLKYEFSGNYKTELEKSFLISDAFFPFADSIELCHKFGIKNIVEPGGSIKDDEVVEAAKKFKLNLIFTGIRHFKH